MYSTVDHLPWGRPGDVALDAGIVQWGEFPNLYVEAVETPIDLQAIRNAGLKAIVDPMYGVGQLTLGTVLTEARCRVTFIQERHNPLFGGRSPVPKPVNSWIGSSSLSRRVNRQALVRSQNTR